MGENPSSPRDGLEDALRRALSDAVGGIEPGADRLDDIRARIDGRPPRPWLLAVLTGVAERVRSWTWRGHWVRPWLPPARAHLPRRARRPRQPKGASAEKPNRRGDAFHRLGTPGGGHIGWLELALGLAGITVIASVSFGVQPVRQAIVHAGTSVLHGGTNPQPGVAGTDGVRTQTGTRGPGPVADGGATAAAARPSRTSAAGPGGSAPGPVAPAACGQPASSAPGKPRPTPTDSGATPSATGTGSPEDRRTPVPVASGTSATPDQPATSPSTCAVTPGTATSTPSATPDSTGASSMPANATPAPTPADTPTYTPTYTPTPTPTYTPTATPSSTVTTPDTATRPASTDQDGSPATPGSGRRHWDLRLRHGEQHPGER